MEIKGEAKLLRIFLGESDKCGPVSLYEKIIIEARKQELAGATVYRGISGFGANSVIHKAKFLTISEDLPLVVEIVDEVERIDKFIPIVKKIFDDSNSGGLITIEKAAIVHLSSTKKEK